MLDRNRYSLTNPNEPVGDLSDWQQYTGLKDKNGKEIYKGDVVEGNPIGWTQTLINDVKWIKDGWYVGKKRLWEDFFGVVKVIGNIYENPELLDSSK